MSVTEIEPFFFFFFLGVRYGLNFWGEFIIIEPSIGEIIKSS